MTAERTPDRLEEALRELPRMEASAGFTEAVLRRVEESAGRRGSPARRRPALAWALATAAAVSLALVAFTLLPRLGPVPGDREALSGAAGPATSEGAARLREEHRRLREEIRALRALVDENPPLLYLGGDDHVDLVFDFLPAADDGGRRARPALASSPEEAR